MEPEAARVALLRHALLNDLFKDLNTSAGKWLRNFLVPLAWPSINRFAHIADAFDEYVEQSGFRQAMRSILPRFVSGVAVRGLDHIPQEGPLLVVSNHPGTYDSIVISAALPRDDLQIIAGGFPLLKSMPATRQHLIFTDANVQSRMAVVRSAIRHLQRDGALLIFPSGRVEPDPASLPGAPEAMRAWSPSLELFLRKVPQTQVVVTIVSGVLAPYFLRNPLIRFWRGVRNPQTVAEVIQILVQLRFPNLVQLMPKISFDFPTTIYELCQGQEETGVLGLISAKARQLLDDHLLWDSDWNNQVTLPPIHSG